MKTITIHVTRIKPPSLHADSIHLRECKAFGKIVTINALSDGQNILTSETNEILKP